MSEEKTTLEIIAPTVEEAIQKGLDQLGLPEEAVEVEVLDAGSRGLFGLGGRQARVRLSLQMNVPVENRPAAVKPESKPVSKPMPVKVEKKQEAEESEVESGPVSEADEESMRVATMVVRDLLERMRVKATVSSRILPPQDTKDQSMVLVEVKGDDLSILIGRHSETLNALQYITNLIVGKELGRWVPMMIDVQGYRERRERQLRQMARRSAEQVVQSGRRIVLEPMPANERRLIHLELRNHSQVMTESTGEDPNRKVCIYLKK